MALPHGWTYKKLEGVEPVVKDDEPIYIYARGHGWIPETPLNKHLTKQKSVWANIYDGFHNWFEDPAPRRREARPANFGYAGGMGARAYVPVVQMVERRIAERMREMRDDARRYWAVYDTETHPVTVTTTAGTAFPAGFDVGWTDDPVTITVTPNTNATPHDPEPERRYFPGVGHTDQPREENIHERRVREYREASERFRRRGR
jgi:hypothetical protein